MYERDRNIRYSGAKYDRTIKFPHGRCPENRFYRRKMVDHPAAVRFVLYGSFARTYHGHGTDRALVGGILGYHPDDERIRDSFEHAKEAGVEFAFEENFTDKEIYPNTVDIYVKDEKAMKCPCAESPSAEATRSSHA